MEQPTLSTACTNRRMFLSVFSTDNLFARNVRDVVLMVCFSQTSDWAKHSAYNQFRAMDPALQDTGKLLEESVVPAELQAGTKEQKGRQLAKIPKRFSLTFLAN